MINEKTLKKLEKILFLLLGYTLLVILWGAWVRISHSGDGCGDSWPLCQGELIPDAETGKTWVEYSHRIMSGSFGIVVTAIWLWGKRNIPAPHPIRTFLLWSFIFMITEALLGAKLVLFGLVTKNDSPLRAIVMALHLVNSLMLMAALTQAWNACKSPSSLKQSQKISHRPLLYFIVLCMTGAVAALATTLFPSQSLLTSLQDDLNMNSHYLIRLRGTHPLLGIFIGSTLAFIAYKKNQIKISGIIMLTVVIGLLTLFLLSPVSLKLLHLFMIHLVWIHLVIWWRNSRELR